MEGQTGPLQFFQTSYGSAPPTTRGDGYGGAGGWSGGSGYGMTADQQQYGSYISTDSSSSSSPHETFDDEPPLLHELGINPSHILSKTRSVLNPLQSPDSHIMDDTDLAGPLVFCLLFGCCLLLTGKVQFGYIYGISTFGCVSMYVVLNLMSDMGIDINRTASVLGYCLLPMIMLAVLALILNIHSFIGYIFTFLAIGWCTYSASLMFVTVLSMRHQQPLVVYPVGLLYTCFALMTIF